MEGYLRKLFVCQSIKKIKPAPRLILGVSLCGATGYILYLLLRKRPDAEECTYASTYLTGEDWSKLVIQVPRQFVPFIIGRKGQKIREIEDKTGTKISFEREINNENTCECTIRGVPVQCEQAQYIIEDLIEQAPVISTESFTVARILIVSVLGKNEENLNYIQERSGAKMWVSEDLGSEARVYIRGTAPQITNASIRINTLIEQERIRREMWQQKLSLRLPRFSPIMENGTLTYVRQYHEKLTQSTSNGLIEVYVSAVETPSKFCVQIVGPKANELDLLVELMTEYYINEDSVSAKVEVGDIIAAPYEHDDKWYRAKVLSLQTDYAEVYYVDYGDHGNVPYDKLRELTPDYLGLPYQGIECYLSGVKPVGEEWTEDAIDTFAAMTHVAQWKKLTARVSRYREQDATLQQHRERRESSPVPGIDLYEVNQKKDVDIAAELVKSGHAVYEQSSSDFLSTSSQSSCARYESMTNDSESLNSDVDSLTYSQLDMYKVQYP